MLKSETSHLYFVHESSYVDEPSQIGEGTSIWHFCHVLKETQIGKQCKIGQNVVMGPRVTIGNNVKIQNNVSVYPGVILEDDVFCGPSMVFTNVMTPRSPISRNTDADFKKTLVRQGASIGANSTIVCGITIGRYAFIGAGAVVTRDIPDYALVYGNPARQHGWVCYCGETLTERVSQRFECGVCHKQYRLFDNKQLKSLEETDLPETQQSL